MEDSLNYQVSIKKCKWKHYKGGLYETVEVVFDSRDAMPLVLYRSLENGQLWVRPIKEFFENIETEDYKGPRFMEEI